jgi:transcriptional regulator with XRE-family HTH domain
MADRANVYPLRREPAPQRQEPRPQESPPQEPLWREVLGERLRTLRLDQEETLSQTAGRAGISPQYLSEIERGRKEPSSEMIAALAGALGTTLTGLTEQVAEDLRRQQAPAQRQAQQQAQQQAADRQRAAQQRAAADRADHPRRAAPGRTSPVNLRLAA